MSIGAYEYGDEIKSKINLKDTYGNITNFLFDDPLFTEHANNPSHDNSKNIKLYLNCLSLCHTVIAQYNDPKDVPPAINEGLLEDNEVEMVIPDKLIYQSSSPDELALVNAARYFNYVFLKRDISNNIYIVENGVEVKYEILHIIEYTSER